MTASKQILGVVLGVCVTLLIVLGITSSSRASAIAADVDAATWQAPAAEAAACGKCGDGYCNPRCGETETSCPRDCGGTTSVAAACGKCGDGYCNPRCGENETNCPRDCGVASVASADCSM